MSERISLTNNLLAEFQKKLRNSGNTQQLVVVNFSITKPALNCIPIHLQIQETLELIDLYVRS